MPRTQKPTPEDAVVEEIVSLDRLSLIDSIAAQERHPQTEYRLISALFSGDEWQQMDAWDAYRRGCKFNGLPVEINERLLRTTIRLYGLTFPDSPEAFRTCGVY